MTYIYHLLDTADRVKYVGLSGNPYQRLITHMESSAPAGQWTQGLVADGGFPQVRIVGIGDSDAERDEIRRCHAAGEPLCNIQHLPIPARDRHPQQMGCPSEGKLITVTQAAKVLKVSKVRVRQLIMAGRLPALWIGFRYVLSKSDVIAFHPMKRGRPKNAKKSRNK